MVQENQPSYNNWLETYITTIQTFILSDIAPIGNPGLTKKSYLVTEMMRQGKPQKTQ